MKRRWITWLCLGAGLLLILLLTLNLGARIGGTIAEAQIHNEQLRYLKQEINELEDLLSDGDLEQSKLKVRRISELTSVLVDAEDFMEILNSRDD